LILPLFYSFLRTKIEEYKEKKLDYLPKLKGMFYIVIQMLLFGISTIVPTAFNINAISILYYIILVLVGTHENEKSINMIK